MIRLLKDWRFFAKGSIVTWGKGLEDLGVKMGVAEYVTTINTKVIQGPRHKWQQSQPQLTSKV